MTFLTTSLLLGLLAAAVPVIIHLLHRQRTVPVQWGAMQFLLETPLQFRRRRKIDHWLLLLARMALLALLAFLLARPLLKAAALNPLPTSAAADIAVVIDHSLSAGRKAASDLAATSRPTVFDRGVSVFESVAGQLRPNDTLGVVLAEHRPNTALTPLPVRSAAARDVYEQLRRLKPGLTSGSIPDAVQAAREMLARGPNVQKVILVVSDAQRNAWQIDNAAGWSAALGDRASSAAPRVYSLAVPAEAGAVDISVGGLTVEPGVVGAKRPAQVTATLTNAGPTDAGAVNATLVVNGKPAGRQSLAGLKAGASGTVRFDHAFVDPGSAWIEVRADVDDALKADDSVVAAVNVRRHLPVLIIDGQLTAAGGFQSSQYLVAAMQPVAEESQAHTALIQPKVINASAAEAEPLAPYAAVVVNDVPQLGAATVENLAAYARAGHGIWVILGPRFEPAALGKQLAQAGLFTADVREKQSPPAPGGVELKAPQNPMVALLAAAERNAMTGALTRQWWNIAPSDGGEQVVLAATGSNDPLVLDRPIGQSGGRVVVWTTSADGAWNNWPLMPNFVPLVNETIHHLAGAGEDSPQRRRLDAGMPIEWSGPAEPRIKSATITLPDGTTVVRQVSLAGGRQRLTYNDTAEPGLYTLRFDPTEVPQPVYFGVGIDRRELDRATLTEADDAWLKSRGFIEAKIRADDLPTVLGAAAPAAEVSRWLALGVLALLVFETVMTRRMVGLQASPENGGLDAAHAGI